jgi:hypothetical protein
MDEIEGVRKGVEKESVERGDKEEVWGVMGVRGVWVGWGGPPMGSKRPGHVSTPRVGRGSSHRRIPPSSGHASPGRSNLKVFSTYRLQSNVRVFTFLIVAFALKSGFDEGSLPRGEDLHPHDALEDRDLREELFSHGQGEAEASSVLVAVLGGGVMLEAGEAFMEPEQGGEVLVGGLGDEVEHGVVAFDEGAGPAAEAGEISVAIEVEEVRGLQASSGGFEAQEVPDVAGAPASDRGDDLEGVWALFVEPGAVAAFGAFRAAGVQALIAGFGFSEAQADQDGCLGRINVLAEPGLGGADLKVTGAPTELRVRGRKAAGEHLCEEATLRLRGDVNGVQVKGTAIGKVTGALGEAGVGIEHGGVFDAGVGVDEDDLFDQIMGTGRRRSGRSAAVAVESLPPLHITAQVERPCSSRRVREK